MSLYSDYINECGVRGIVETEKGFATYQISNLECWIPDIYIVPEHRKSKAGSDIADAVAKIAKEQGCKYLSGTVDTQFKEATRSMQVLLGYGFKYNKHDSRMLWFIKEI